MKAKTVPLLWLGACLGAFGGCAHTPAFRTPLSPLGEDAVLDLASGARFQAARGWHAAVEGDAAVLRDPENDVWVAVVALEASGAEAALERAWRHVWPDPAPPVQTLIRPPARDGWDEIVQVEYATRPEDRMAVMAVARRSGARWYVTLLLGSQAGLDRRAAQATTVITSLEAPGVEQESLAGRPVRPLEGERLQVLLDFLTHAMAAADVPGAALAVVGPGGVSLHGLGTREAGRTEPVTADTLFMVGSTTKMLTSLMMATAVETGAFAWDTPAVALEPSFALGDADTTARVEMRHTLCACTGLPRQDLEFLFEWEGSTPESRLASLAGMKPTTGFGETFQYSNTLVAAGGYLAARALHPGLPLGQAYDRAMAERVFGPLGMTRTTFDFDAVLRQEHASPHAAGLDGGSRPFPLREEGGVSSVRPAGAAWSSVRDMARIVQLELGRGGLPEGERLLSEAALLARRAPQVRITDKLAYGLGLFVEDDHGLELVHHGGNNLGYTADLFLLPVQGWGAVLLTNAGGANALRSAFRRRFLELLLDARPLAEAALAERLRVEREELAKLREGLEPFAPDRRELLGAYRAEGLGRIELRARGQTVILDAGEWLSSLRARRRERGPLLLLLADPPLAGLELRVEPGEGRPRIHLPFLQHDYVFEPETP